MGFISDSKLLEQARNNTYTCSCGHRITMSYCEYSICRYCGHKVLSNKGKLNQFKNKMKEMLK